MRDSIANNLRVLLKAKIDCIWIQTYEEKEVIADIKELVAKNDRMSNMTVQVWSRTEGVTRVPVFAYEQDDKPDAKLKEPPALFSKIRNEQQEATGSSNLWILRDFHTVVTDPKVQRFVRDLKEYNGRHYNPLIVISPAMEIPSDIARLFRVIEYELPPEEAVLKLIQKANETLAMSASEDNDVHVSTPEEISALTKACMGLTIKEINMALNESMVGYHSLNLEFLSKNKIELVKKTGVLDYKIPHDTLADIGGNEAIKKWLLEAKDAFSDEARAFGVEKPKGYMAVGIPGCGKTLLAGAFANEMKVPLLELSMSKIMDKLVGQSERKIDHALQVAKACAPCVLLLDEVEKMLGSAGAGGSSNQSDGGVTNRVFQAILKFMNDNDSGVYVIMTSNDVSQLPPEFTRAGRLDATWYFGLPSAVEREDIFKVHFNHRNKSVGDVILKKAVDATKGFTGAEIQQTVKNTMVKAYQRYKQDGNANITVDDVISAAADVIPVSRSSREKIAALENYCRTRARFASGEDTVVAKPAKEEQEEAFLLDLD
jgi:ATP-dependent 26S proteasome regulatory subunit